MKKIKTIGKLAIYEASDKEISKADKEGILLDRYHLFLKDSLEHGYQYGDLEWTCDTLAEAIEWAKGY